MEQYKTIALNLEASQVERLRGISATNEVSLSELGRAAIRVMLAGEVIRLDGGKLILLGSNNGVAIAST